MGLFMGQLIWNFSKFEDVEISTQQQNISCYFNYGNVITSQIDYLNPAPPNEDAWNCRFFYLIQKSSVSFLFKPKIKVCRS